MPCAAGWQNVKTKESNESVDDMKWKKIITSIGEIRFTKLQIYLLSFLVPMAAMLACMIGFEVQPFGGNSFMIVDALHQYMPFFTVLYDKLKGGQSLFYSFRSGLGINFLALFSYYLSSPLNLLILLFKKDHLNMALSLLMAVKIALSGLSAAIYFGEKYKKSSGILLVVSMTYALNSYMVGYSWNIMWLDAIMIFPIVLLGIERLIEKKDGRLYGIALFYALYCNYYIAFMICIFAVFWFLLYQFSSVRQFIRRGFSFAGYSLLAAGMAAVVLLPAYLGIKQTASGEDMSIPGHSFLTTFTDLINRQFALANPISHDNFDGNANLYFGIFSLLMLGIYFFNRKISLEKKVRILGLYLFLMLSCNEEILNFIWHGFHNQYGIPNRFSFMMGFLLLYMMMESLDNQEGIEMWHCLMSAVLIGGLIWVSRSGAGDPLDDKTYLMCLILLIFYALVLSLFSSHKMRQFQRMILLIFSIVAIGEMCVTSILGFDAIGQIRVAKFFTGIQDMDTATEDLANGDFFRGEMAEARLVDESTMYPINGVGLFGSTAKHDMVKIMDSLGYYTGCNEYLYKGDCALTNFLLDVKYQYYRDMDQKTPEFQYKASYGDFDVYENPVQDMSPGYLMNLSVDDWFYRSAYPFRVLNDLCQTAWNSAPVFHMIQIKDPVSNGVSLRKTNDGEYHFTLDNVEEDNITFTIPVQEYAPELYLHYDGSQVAQAEIQINGEMLLCGDEDSKIICLGQVQKGSNVTVIMKLKGEHQEGTVRLSMASLVQERFEHLIEKVSASRFIVTKHSENHMEGRITADREQYLFFSIPYDEGWSVKVDGKNQETHKIGNAFLSVIIPAGEHEITLHYISPGFSTGWKLSLISLLIFIVLNVYHLKFKKTEEIEEDGPDEEIHEEENDDENNQEIYDTCDISDDGDRDADD